MSWAEDLKKYEIEKQTLPTAIAHSEPIRRFTKGGGAREARQHREYDIVSNTAPSPEAEATFRNTREENQRRQRERATAKQLNTTQHNYNIITMEMTDGQTVGPDGRSEDGREVKIKGNRPPRGKLVSKDGSTFASTAQFALEPEAWVSPPPTPRTQHRNALKKAHAEAREREFNIVNQRYRTEHEEKAAHDAEAEQRRIALAVQKSEQYNPLTCQYRYLDDEEAARAEEAVRAQHVRVPNLVKKSDGATYDILSKEVLNEAQLKQYDLEASKGIIYRSRRVEEYEKKRDAHEEEADWNRVRAVNRINQLQRGAEAVAHGYDILSNRPFQTEAGPEACARDAIKVPVPLSTFRPLSTIDAIKVQQQKMMSIGSAYNNNTNNTNNTLGENGLANANARQTQSCSAGGGGGGVGGGSPRTSFERLFLNPNRAIGNEEMAEAERERQQLLHELPTAKGVGYGLLTSGSWEDSMTRTAKDYDLEGKPAGGAANLMDKGELMGKNGRLKKIGPNHSETDPSSTLGRRENSIIDSIKREEAAGIVSSHKYGKKQLKPLVSKNLLKKGHGVGGVDSELRSFF